MISPSKDHLQAFCAVHLLRKNRSLLSYARLQLLRVNRWIKCYGTPSIGEMPFKASATGNIARNIYQANEHETGLVGT